MAGELFFFFYCNMQSQTYSHCKGRDIYRLFHPSTELYDHQRQGPTNLLLLINPQRLLFENHEKWLENVFRELTLCDIKV